MSDAATGDNPTATPVQDARALLRAARGGTLATSADGQPFASLVTPATAPDGSVLMLLSGLSEHTRHLRDEPRCAVMVAGPPAGLNPQTAPRLTVTGLAAHEPDPAMKARWVALHPYAAFYAGFADFQVFRLRPVAGQFIGGFASATRLRQADLQWDPAAVSAVAAAEAEVIAHCNADHPDALDAIAMGAGAGQEPDEIIGLHEGVRRAASASRFNPRCKATRTVASLMPRADARSRTVRPCTAIPRTISCSRDGSAARQRSRSRPT